MSNEHRPIEYSTQDWVDLYCERCNRHLGYATPGSQLKVRCKSCKHMSNMSVDTYNNSLTYQ